MVQHKDADAAMNVVFMSFDAPLVDVPDAQAPGDPTAATAIRL
jgi:hypothetical protein